MSNQIFCGVKVVIVNWNRPIDTIECIHSLFASGVMADQVLVVDNGSDDDSLETITITFPPIELVKLTENLGFAGGYNTGIQKALKSDASSIFILNNDTLVDEKTVSQLMSADYDICVPKIYYQKPPDKIWAAGAHWRRFPPMVVMRGYQKKDDNRFDNPMDLEFATGCALMVKRKVFEQVGLFDRDYVNYFEDYDFVYRAHAAGFRIRYVPEAKVWHKVAQTLGSESPKRLWYLGRNSVLFYRKKERFSLWTLYIFLTWVTLREAIKLNFHELRNFWRGVRDGMKKIKHG